MAYYLLVFFQLLPKPVGLLESITIANSLFGVLIALGIYFCPTPTNKDGEPLVNVRELLLYAAIIAFGGIPAIVLLYILYLRKLILQPIEGEKL